MKKSCWISEFARFVILLPTVVYVTRHYGARAIVVEKVVVPEVVRVGETVKLQCHYREEGDKLYSLKWWRGDDQFYQYIPPNRTHFPAKGIRVDMPRTLQLNNHRPAGLETVILTEVGMDAEGLYKCEVMADINFETVTDNATMTVIHPPIGNIKITSAQEQDDAAIRPGQRIILVCTSPPSSPAPTLTWHVNDKRASPQWVKYHSDYSRRLVQVSATLDFIATDSLLQEAEEDLKVTCSVSQPISGISISETMLFRPLRRPLFWGLFSGSSAFLPTHILITTLVPVGFRGYLW